MYPHPLTRRSLYSQTVERTLVRPHCFRMLFDYLLCRPRLPFRFAVPTPRAPFCAAPTSMHDACNPSPHVAPRVSRDASYTARSATSQTGRLARGRRRCRGQARRSRLRRCCWGRGPGWGPGDPARPLATRLASWKPAGLALHQRGGGGGLVPAAEWGQWRLQISQHCAIQLEACRRWAADGAGRACTRSPPGRSATHFQLGGSFLVSAGRQVGGGRGRVNEATWRLRCSGVRRTLGRRPEPASERLPSTTLRMSSLL